MKYEKSKMIASLMLAGMMMLTGCSGSGEEKAKEPKMKVEAIETEGEKKGDQQTPKEDPNTQMDAEQPSSDESKKTEGGNESPKVEETKKEPEKEAPAPKTETKTQASEPQKPAEPAPAPAAEVKTEEAKPASKYKDGSYTGTAAGYNGDITVNLTIQGDKITALSVSSHNEDEMYFADAQAVIGKILQAQSTAVDSVSGATYSSNGIKAAAKAALDKAKN